MSSGEKLLEITPEVVVLLPEIAEVTIEGAGNWPSDAHLAQASHYLRHDAAFINIETDSPAGQSRGGHRVAKSLTGLAAAAASFVGVGGRVAEADDASGPELAPNQEICVDTTGQPEQVGTFNLTPVDAEGAGYGVLYPKGALRPDTSNVNFSLNSTIPNTATTPIGADSNGNGFGEICYYNSNHVRSNIIIDQQVLVDVGILSNDAKRLVNTRDEGVMVIDPFNKFSSINGQERPQIGKLEKDQAFCVDTTGTEGELEFINITPVDAEGAGYGVVYPQGDPAPETSNVNFGRGTVIPNTARVAVGIDTNGNGFGEICYKNSRHTQSEVIIDEQMRADAELVSSIARRLVNTRERSVKLVPGEELCVDTTGQPDQELVGSFNITPVDAEGPGYGVLYPKGALRPNTSNVNFSLNSTIPNTAIVPVGADSNGNGFGEICYYNSNHVESNVIIDQQALLGLGLLSTNATRLINTREGLPLPPPTPACDKVTWFEYYEDGSRGFAVYNDEDGTVSRHQAQDTVEPMSGADIDPDTCENPEVIYSQINYTNNTTNLYRLNFEEGTSSPMQPSQSSNIDKLGSVEPMFGRVCYVEYMTGQRNVRSTTFDDYPCVGSFVDDFSIDDNGKTLARVRSYSQPGRPGAPVDDYVSVEVSRVLNSTSQQNYSYEFTLGTGERVRDIQVSTNGERVYIMRSTDSGQTYQLYELQEDPSVVNSWNGSSGMRFIPVALPTDVSEGQIEGFRAVGDDKIVALVAGEDGAKPVVIDLGSQSIVDLSPTDSQTTGMYM